MSDDFFQLLDAEIAEAVAKSKLKSDAQKLKKRANNMQLSPAERAEAAAEWRSVQAIVEANDWEPVYSAAFFTEQNCDGCGSTHRTFLQYMQKEESVRKRNTFRWVRVPLPMAGLPKETIIQPLITHICADCAPDHGFDPEMPETRLMPLAGGLTVSSTYVQGDINGPQSEN